MNVTKSEKRYYLLHSTTTESKQADIKRDTISRVSKSLYKKVKMIVDFNEQIFSPFLSLSSRKKKKKTQ